MGKTLNVIYLIDFECVGFVSYRYSALFNKSTTLFWGDESWHVVDVFVRAFIVAVCATVPGDGGFFNFALDCGYV